MNCATSSALPPATTSMFPPITADSSTSGGPRPCWPSCKPHDGTSPHVREHRLCLLARALTEPNAEALQAALAQREVTPQGQPQGSSDVASHQNSDAAVRQI